MNKIEMLMVRKFSVPYVSTASITVDLGFMWALAPGNNS
jgi:hypothetical protein